ncbi:MAG: hypothetical protein H0V82_00445 [Candidatus Protochlamydia sp.]|nr:hypothetical protein [Candidatus Protochlamydia sp.]
MNPLYPKVNLINSLNDNLIFERISFVQFENSPQIKTCNTPIFSPEDFIFSTLQTRNICDAEFNPLKSYQNEVFPPLYTSNDEDLTVIKAFLNFLHQPRWIESKSLFDQNNQPVPPFKIEFTFFQLHTFLSEASQIASQHPDSKIAGPFPIIESELIGQYLIELAGAYPFIKFIKKTFPHIPLKIIEDWFQLPHIKNFFAQKAKDMDLRIINDGSLDFMIYLSSQAQNFLATKMENFNPVAYCNLLKGLGKDQYKFLEPTSPLLKKYSLEEFGGVTKRKIVDEEGCKYAIFGEKTNDRSFELIFIGHQPGSTSIGLKNPCLSSRDCFTISLLPLLKDGGKVNFQIKTGPCNPVKALIDLLTNSYSIMDLHPNGWIRYLKYYKKFSQQQMEREILKHIFSLKENYFEKMHGSKNMKIDSSDGFYLFCLLRDEFEKIHPPIDPLFALQYLLRAILSVYENGSVNDEEIARLWNFMETGNYLNLDPHTISHALGIALKRGLRDETLPFSIIHAWMGMVAFLSCPTTFTQLGWSDKGPTHAFHLKFPFSICVVATPQAYFDAVFYYLEENPKCLPALMEIHDSLELNFEKINYPSPLKDCFKIDCNALMKKAEKWLLLSQVNYNLLGIQIYLFAASQDTNCAEIDKLFLSLPSILMKIEPLEKKKELLGRIEAFVPTLAKSHYAEILELIIKNDCSLPPEEFVGILIRQKIEIFHFGLLLWKKLGSVSKETSLLIFKKLITNDPHRAVVHFQNMLEKNILEVEEQFDGFCMLACQASNKISDELPFILIELMPSLNPLLEAAFLVQDRNVKKKLGHKIFSPFCQLLKCRNFHPMAEKILMEAGRFGLFEAENLSNLWLMFLEQKLDFCPANSVALLYYTLEEQKIIPRTLLKHPGFQQFKIELGTRLLKEKENVLSQKLLEELIKSPLQPSSVPSLYDFLANHLTCQLKIEIKEDLLHLFKHLILNTPKNKSASTAELIKLLCETTSNPSIFPSLDKLLIETITLINGGRPLLLNYLENSMRFSLEPRFPLLWTLVDKIFLLKGHPSEMVQFLKIGSKMLNEGEDLSFPPPIEFKAWLGKKHTMVLSTLLENSCYEECFAYMLTLNKYVLAPIESFEAFYWQLCRHYLHKNDEMSFNKHIKLLTLWETSAKPIDRSDYSSVQAFIHHLLKQNDPRSALMAFEWIELSWYLAEGKEEKKLLEQALFCSLNKLNLLNQNLEAFDLLKGFLAKHAPDPETKENYQNIWIRLVSSLQPIISMEKRKSFFLSCEAKSLFLKQTHLLEKMAKQEAESYLKRPLNEQDLTIAFEFFDYYLLHDEGLWLKLLLAVEKGGFKNALSQCTALFKQIENSLACPLFKARCWVVYLNCLRQIKHPDLNFYFEELSLLKKNVFSNSSTEKEEMEAYREILLAQIEELNSTDIDQKKYEAIVLAKEKYRLSGSEEWDFELEKALILKLQSFKQIECYQFLCNRLAPFIIDFHKKRDKYAVFVKCIETVIQNGYKEHFDEEAAGLLKLIFNNAFPDDSRLRMINALKNPQPFLFPIFISFMYQLSKNGNLELQKKLKDPLISLYPAALAHASLKSIKKYEEVLFQAIKVTPLSADQQAVLINSFLTRFLYLHCHGPQSIQSEIAVDTFVKWAPFLFAHPDLLKVHLKVAFELSRIYANPDSLNLQDKSKFTDCLKKIIQIKYHETLKRPVLKEIRHHYFKWCIQFLKELHFDADCLAIGLDTLVTGHIEDYALKKNLILSIPTEDIAEELEELIYFWPVPPRKSAIVSHHFLAGMAQNKFTLNFQENLSKITLAAYAAGIFKNNQPKFVELSLYLQLGESIAAAEKVILTATSSMIRRLLSFQKPTPLMYAIFSLNQWNGADRKVHGEEYLSKSKEIAKACQEHPLAIANGESLFYTLYSITLRNLSYSTYSIAQQQSIKMAHYQYENAWEIFQHVKDNHPLEYSVHYLELCCALLTKQFFLQGKKRDFALYEQRLQKIMPEIIHLESRQWPLDEKIQLTICPKGGLAETFFYLLLEFDNSQHAPLLTKEKQLGQNLMLTWLNALMNVKTSEQSFITCETVCYTLLNTRKSQIFNSDSLAAVSCFEKALAWIPLQSDKIDPFHLKYIEINFNLKKRINDYSSYLNCVKGLADQFVNLKLTYKEPASLGLLGELFLQLPDKPSEEVVLQRNISFSRFLQTILEKVKTFCDEDTSLEPIHGSITELLNSGDLTKALTENLNETVETVEACLDFISLSSPAMAIFAKMFRLKFYTKKRSEKFSEEIFNGLVEVMVTAIDQMIKLKNFVPPFDFNKILRKIPVADQIYAEKLRLKWIQLLKELCSTLEKEHPLNDHVKELEK